MKQGLVFGFIFLTFSSVAIASEHSHNVGFAAPTISGTANVSGPELGAIVFDTSQNEFYGYGGATPGWLQLTGTISSGAPTGAVTGFAGTTAPAGYLLCDGSAVSRTTYASLYAVIGTTYGAGDGSTTFNVPNAQGVFLRGAGSQTISSITYTGSQGTTQGDQLQGHYHSVSNTNALFGYGSSPVGFPYDNTGAAQFSYPAVVDVGSPTNDGTNGTPRTGAETRPANISVLYIIKY